jgi:hypothetical protein
MVAAGYDDVRKACGLEQVKHMPVEHFLTLCGRRPGVKDITAYQQDIDLAVNDYLSQKSHEGFMHIRNPHVSYLLAYVPVAGMQDPHRISSF